MARYIDADVLLANNGLAGMDKHNDSGELNRSALASIPLYEIKRMIDDAPTVKTDNVECWKLLAGKRLKRKNLYRDRADKLWLEKEQLRLKLEAALKFISDDKACQDCDDCKWCDEDINGEHCSGCKDNNCKWEWNGLK